MCEYHKVLKYGWKCRAFEVGKVLFISILVWQFDFNHCRPKPAGFANTFPIMAALW